MILCRQVKGKRRYIYRILCLAVQLACRCTTNVASGRVFWENPKTDFAFFFFWETQKWIVNPKYPYSERIHWIKLKSGCHPSRRFLGKDTKKCIWQAVFPWGYSSSSDSLSETRAVFSQRRPLPDYIAVRWDYGKFNQDLLLHLLKVLFRFTGKTSSSLSWTTSIMQQVFNCDAFLSSVLPRLNAFQDFQIQKVNRTCFRNSTVGLPP